METNVLDLVRIFGVVHFYDLATTEQVREFERLVLYSENAKKLDELQEIQTCEEYQ